MRTYVRDRGRTIRTQLNELRRAFRRVYQSAEMRGGAKDAFDSNVVNVHMPILNGLEEVYHELNDTITRMINHVQEHIPEGSRHGVIGIEALDVYLEFMGDEHSNVQDANVRYQSVYNAIGDLAAVSMPSTATYDSALTELNDEARRIRDRLESLSITITPLEELVETVSTEINRVNSELTKMAGNRNNSDWSIAVNPEEFADQMANLRRGRQDTALEGEISVLGRRGGWLDLKDHKLSQFDDLAFQAYLDGCREERVNALVESFRDEEGNWDLEMILVDLFNYGIRNGFTNTQWGALVQLFSEELSFEEMISIYSVATILPEIGTHAPEVMHNLMQAVADILVVEFENFADGTSDLSESELDDLFRRMQLLMLLDDLSSQNISIQLNDFTNLSEFQNGTAYYLMHDRAPGFMTHFWNTTTSTVDKKALEYTLLWMITHGDFTLMRSIKNTFPWIFAGYNILASDKSIGEAIVHYGIPTGLYVGAGGLLTLASVPKGVVTGGSIAVVFLYSLAYEANFLGLQDGVQWLGEQADNLLAWIEETNPLGIQDGINWIGDHVDNISAYWDAHWDLWIGELWEGMVALEITLDDIGDMFDSAVEWWNDGGQELAVEGFQWWIFEEIPEAISEIGDMIGSWWSDLWSE